MQTETADYRVRAVWELVHVCDGVQRHRSIAPRLKGTVLIQEDSCGKWHEFPSMVEALAFTEERVEQIADIEEEIVELKLKHISAPRDRTLHRLESALAEARRGMKEREK